MPTDVDRRRAEAEYWAYAALAERARHPTATPFPVLPYRGVSLGGAEFAAAVGGVFTANTLGTIPGFYYYPYRDWPDEANYPGGYDQRAYPFFRGLGMNTFRLPFRWERIQRRLFAELDPDELRHLTEAVAAMRASGMFVLLDVHNYMRYATAEKIAVGAYADVIGSPAVPYRAFGDLWGRLASLYKNDSGVSFGLMNEPMGIDDLHQWLHAANAAIAAIRATGATNLILVCGNEWADPSRWTQVSDMLKDIHDPAHNFAFEVHAYVDSEGNGSGNTCPDRLRGVKSLEPFTAWAREHKARGFLGEFSAGIDVDADDNCMAALDEQLSYLKDNSDVYLGWTYWAAGQGFGPGNPMEYGVLHQRNSRQLDVLKKHLR